MTSEMWTSIMIALIGALVGGTIPAVISVRQVSRRVKSQNEKDLAEAQDALSQATKAQVEAVMGLLDPLRKEVEEQRKVCSELKGSVTYLKGQVTSLKKKVRELYTGALVLIRQLDDLGVEPKWTPPCDIMDEIEEDYDGR